MVDVNELRHRPEGPRGWVALWTAIAAVLVIAVGVAAFLYGWQSARVQEAEGTEPASTTAERPPQVGSRPPELLLDEVSGMTAGGLSRAGARRIAAVDDEMRELVVLRAEGGGQVAVERFLSIENRIDDVEALAYDGRGAGHYFVFGSHRESDDGKVTRVLRFSVDGSRLGDPRYRVEKQAILRRNLEDSLEDGVRRARRSLGEDGQANADWLRAWKEHWKEEVDELPNPYALELEAAVCVGPRLFVGLRYPLIAGKAILLEYDLDDPGLGFDAAPGQGSRDWPMAKHVHLLALPGEFGITALAFAPEKRHLLVAANPTAKQGNSNRVLAKDVYEQSWVLAYDVEGEFEQAAFQSSAFRFPGTKLEAMTVLDGELWLGFEGQRSKFDRRPLSELYAASK